MTQAFRAVSSTNYHPVASDYVISYSRDKSKFKLANYSQLVQADASAFYYYEVDRDAAVRIPGGSPAANVWADGAERPKRNDNHLMFRAHKETCIRYDIATQLGDIALEQHNRQWKVKTRYLDMLTSQAMTQRTTVVWQGVGGGGGGWRGLDTSSIWPTTNVADVNLLNSGAGPWEAASADPADGSYMAIRKSLTEAAKRIFLYTNGAVEWSDLRLIVHPDCARAMGNSAEVREYFKYGGAPTSQALEVTNMNAQYGLPSHLYGIEIVVEDSMRATDVATAGATSATTERQFIKNKTNAVILSRQGKLDSVSGPSFSTFQIYYYGDQLSIEEFADPENRLTRWNVVDFFTPVAPALVSGFNITGACSASA